MTDPTTIAANYLAVWNTNDSAQRRDALRREWTTSARYKDPIMESAGHEGVATMIETARASFPGHRFSLHGTPDGHGPFVRFSWTLSPDAGGASVARGTDVARLDEDGRIAEVIGFLDAA